jgi:hypothetical protein
MNQELVITDLTRMSAGHVCVAGYSHAGQAIRLDWPPVLEHDLFRAGRPIAFPAALVECALIKRQPKPPHTEDFMYDPASLRFVRRLDDSDWQAVLDRSRFDNVQSLFDQPIREDFGHYIADGAGPRSIGSLQPLSIAQASYSPGTDGTWDYRLSFSDQTGQFYRLKITDLTWHAYCDSLRATGCVPIEIANQVTRLLKSRPVYLRLGLSRKWSKFPDRCYLQINGIYTFPDYLQGKTFADLRPPAPA